MWVDPTVFCLRPLVDWLDDHYRFGFFAFRNPARDRMMSNWFIASERNNPLLVALHQTYFEFLTRRIFVNQNSRGGRFLVRHLTPNSKQELSPHDVMAQSAFAAFCRAYPYFVFHYTFNKLILTRQDLRALWIEVNSLDASADARAADLRKGKGRFDEGALRARAKRLADAKAKLAR